MLAWLDPDRDKAGAKYETIRTRLIKIFMCRGCHEAEDLADETINRVTSKLGELASSYQGDPALFFYGVAKKVRHEYEKRKFRRVPPAPMSQPADAEQRYECLDTCIRALTRDQLRLILQYYRDDKRAKINNRKRLAGELGIAINALRIRAHRIKSALQQCVDECMRRQASA